MIWLCRLLPECQVPKLGFDHRGVAYLAGQALIDSDGAPMVSRLWKPIEMLRLLTLISTEEFLILRGDVETSIVQKLERLQAEGEVCVESIRWDRASTFAIALRRRHLPSLKKIRFEDWLDYSGLTTSKMPPREQLLLTAHEQNESKWVRTSALRAKTELIPVFWEGRFSLHCLYVPEPLQIANEPRLFKLLPGFAAVDETDAMGEGRPAAEFFTASSP